MQTVPDHVGRLVPFVAPLAAITVKIAVDAYFLAVDLQRRQRTLAVGGQLRGVDAMDREAVFVYFFGFIGQASDG